MEHDDNKGVTEPISLAHNKEEKISNAAYCQVLITTVVDIFKAVVNAIEPKTYSGDENFSLVLKFKLAAKWEFCKFIQGFVFKFF
jgi:hypothetical protein